MVLQCLRKQWLVFGCLKCGDVENAVWRVIEGRLRPNYVSCQSAITSSSCVFERSAFSTAGKRDRGYLMWIQLCCLMAVLPKDFFPGVPPWCAKEHLPHHNLFSDIIHPVPLLASHELTLLFTRVICPLKSSVLCWQRLYTDVIHALNPLQMYQLSDRLRLAPLVFAR